MVQHDAPVCVIGGVNMDIAGTPDASLRTGDSNPGRVSLSPGGVGRNIAENLCRLGRQVFLVSVLGEDAYAAVIREHCRNIGIDLRYCITDPLGRTSTYLCLNERDGDLHAAVADMSICDQLTPDRLEGLLPVLNGCALVIADANLPEETLAWIGANVTSPLAADPVSVAKAGRLKPLKKKRAEVVEVLKNRSEFKDEDCFKFVDQEAGEVGYYNEEGILVYQRTILPTERQKTLFATMPARQKTGTDN